MVKNLPSKVGDMGSFPGWETKIPVPMCYKATKPVCCNWKAYAPHY